MITDVSGLYPSVSLGLCRHAFAIFHPIYAKAIMPYALTGIPAIIPYINSNIQATTQKRDGLLTTMQALCVAMVREKMKTETAEFAGVIARRREDRRVIESNYYDNSSTTMLTTF
jgi:hypothetical protein